MKFQISFNIMPSLLKENLPKDSSYGPKINNESNNEIKFQAIMFTTVNVKPKDTCFCIMELSIHLVMKNVGNILILLFT